MLDTPYRIIVVPPVSRTPSDEQLLWMQRRLKLLAKSALNLGLEGNCVHIKVYPMRTGLTELTGWAANWLRPEHCQMSLLRQVHAWNTSKMEVQYLAGHVMREIVSWSPDEVWCFNELGHGTYSNSAPARIWRESQELSHVAARFKLVPSWVNSEAPEKPAKEKSNGKANGNKLSSPAPASNAGGGRGKRVAKDERSPWGVPRTRY